MKIDRINHELLISGERLPLPVEDDEDGEADEKFELTARRISEWFSKECHNEKGRKQYDSLSLIVYGLLIYLVEQEQAQVIDRRLELLNYKPKKKCRRPIFQDMVYAVTKHSEKLLTPTARRRIGLSLWYAYRHYVPEEFLIGFLRTHRNENFEKKFSDKAVDKNYINWIAHQFALEVRGFPGISHHKNKIRKAIEKAAAVHKGRFAEAFSRIEQFAGSDHRGEDANGDAWDG